MVKFAVLTISNRVSRGEREDVSGKKIIEMLEDNNYSVVHYEVIPDDIDKIVNKLTQLSDRVDVDVIVTTGGTGLSPSDVTPDATEKVCERLIPGIPEAMRFDSLKKTPYAMISRMTAGVRNKTLIINLPGSPSGAEDCLSVVLNIVPHAVKLIKQEKILDSEHKFQR
jgi:molybdenum cofactor synthesis domain-containing protein